MSSIAQLHEQLAVDDWRAEKGFSADFEAVNAKIFNSSSDVIANAVNEWLGQPPNQPCLFGRIAAKLNLITYCILTEEDLTKSDDFIREKIQKVHTDWTRAAFEGQKSAFVVLAISKRACYARPDSAMANLAQRLGSLYLLDDIAFDAVYLDHLYLEMPGKNSRIWHWRAGVNFFSAQGDGRWWQDHRIPGGFGFSVNSVGHMVKSSLICAAMRTMEKAVHAEPEGWDASSVNSLEKALDLAMKTISGASEAISGKATELLPRDATAAKCPYKVSTAMEAHNPCEYRGYYHTDFTLPSEYFRPEIQRPAEIKPHTLDFTYLFHRSADNPAHETMGEGQLIRAEGSGEPLVSNMDKRLMSQAEEGTIFDFPGLEVALKNPAKD